jgi:hypothetical protein
MNRRAARIAFVCFLLGLGTTIAIAWAVRTYTFKYPRPIPPQIYQLTDDRSEWDIHITRRPGHMALHYIARVDLESGWGMMYNSADDPNPLPLPREPRWAGGTRLDAPAAYTVTAVGWPLLCLKQETIRPKALAQASRRTGTWLAPASLGPLAGTPFPLAPIPLGLAANTLAWGAGWWLILAGIPILRRARRRRAGFCIACGYDIRDSHGACPECGNR